MNTSITQANKSPLNNSKAKAMFSFPRGERFPQLSESSRYDPPHAVFSMTKLLFSVNGPLPLASVISLILPRTFCLI